LKFIRIKVMETIQLEIPSEMLGVINTLSKKKEEFVLEAIQEKIEREKKDKLKLLLIEGYQATSEEDLEITKDFEGADFDNL
jgi:hypothetical protein